MRSRIDVLKGLTAAIDVPMAGRTISGALRVAATAPRNLAGRHLEIARVPRRAHLDTGAGAGIVCAEPFLF
jgi:hypothetical protein